MLWPVVRREWQDSKGHDDIDLRLHQLRRNFRKLFGAQSIAALVVHQVLALDKAKPSKPVPKRDS
jgi:hypothetical protein